jgi:PAS domain S-box-containing protein
MDKNPITPKTDKLGRDHRRRKQQVETPTADLKTTNESFRAEITRLKRTEEELNSLIRIAQEITAASDFVSSTDIALRRICEFTGWTCAEAWVLSSDGTVLEYSRGWYGESKSFERFKQQSQNFQFPLGVGLPGQVWASKRPTWIQDISAQTEREYPRYRLAKELGLKSALGIPILANDKLVALLVFFMSEVREEDKRLVEIFASVAGPLASMLRHKQDEQALLEREALLQHIIDESTNIIWVKDSDGYYQLSNKEHERLVGLHREHVKGKTDYDLFPEHVAEYLRANDRKVMEAGSPLVFEESAPLDDGFHVYISNKFPMHDANGKVYAVCGIATDITERKRAEKLLERRVQERTAELQRVNDTLQAEISQRRETEQRLRASEEQLRHSLDFNLSVMANMGEGLYTLDGQGLVAYVNPAAERLLGWSSTELFGRKMHDVIHYQYPDGTSYPAEECAGLQVLRKGMVLSNHEDVFIRKDGTFFPVVYTSSPIRSGGGISGLVVAFRDITAQKEAEEALLKSREELRALAVRLQAVREQDRTTLAREIHDELSGTLTALKMDLSLLPDRAKKDQRTFLEKLSSMSSLIDRTMGQVHTIVSELRPVVLDKFGLVAAIEWQTSEFQERSGVTCETHLPPAELPLDSDRSTAIFRILQEALTNVARHSHASHVVVDLRNEAGSAILTVRDNGVGIDDSAIDAHSSIGLIGMRERALAFDGKTEVTRLREGGTLVGVRIPINAARLNENSDPLLV